MTGLHGRPARVARTMVQHPARVCTPRNDARGPDRAGHVCCPAKARLLVVYCGHCAWLVHSGGSRTCSSLCTTAPAMQARFAECPPGTAILRWTTCRGRGCETRATTTGPIRRGKVACIDV